MVLKFPSSIHGRMPEHGTFPIHMQPAPHNAVLVTCNDYLGMLKLGHTSQPKNLDAVTHDSQLCGAIYNKTFKQVSICAVSYNCNSVIHLIMVALFFKNIEKTITIPKLHFYCSIVRISFLPIRLSVANIFDRKL